ncbi:MAG: ATP-dependent DNA helicase DinG [Haliea sp.]|nr:ATP-dependent DNA helicase DinG [Haliea sp.]
MLSEELKERIREAYNAIMERKSLTPRWGQRQMIAEIANTLARIPGPGARAPDSPAVCVIEAGTGTGKTIAYAVAAIPLAQALDKRLVVATATIALQEQFVNKDLPDIRDSSGLAFSFALAKGRRRYVCLSKLDRLMAQGQGESELLPLYPDEVDVPARAEALPVYTAMLDALGRGQWDGDRDNWPDSMPEEIWYGATTDHAQCSGRRCPNISQCSFYRARDELQSADIIVTNHDLALSDLALGGGAILSAPEDSIYVFDEGHHLPDKALSHFASFCRLHTTIQWLQDSAKLLTQAAPVLGALESLQRPLQSLPAVMDEAADSLAVAEQQVAVLFESAEVNDSRDDQQLRFEHGLVPSELIPVATTVAGHFEKLATGLARMEAKLEEALEDDFAGLDKSEVETWHINVGGMLGRAESTLALWREYAVTGEGESPPRARWITLLNSGGQFGFELRCSPVLAADILEDCLWSRAAGVVVTSATITALNSFERFILHSGAPREGNYKVVTSPFDYANATFRVPSMDCDPGDAQAHTDALIEDLPTILDPAEGSLVLFSSRRQMLDVYQGISAELGDRLLMQGDYSKQEILRRHREAIDAGRGSVIFGLASFAEGVDLPGDYCRHVVIAKIPFAVPDSPLEAALAEWVEAQGRNAFMEISVPDAALRLVQASGRLLRTEQDTGRVTLMDRRIVTRRYGRAILDSLPPFKRELE